MERPDLASNLEFWSGRARHGGAGVDPERRPPSYRLPPRWSGSFWRSLLRRAGERVPRLTAPGGRRPRSPRGRARPIAAAALLAGLTAAWLSVGHQSHSSAAIDSPPPTLPAVTTVSTRASTTTTTSTVVARSVDCRGLSPARPEVRCVIDGVDLDARLLTTATVATAYALATGARSGPRSGLPACARGLPDERSWSDAASPDAAVGRYWCGLEHGHAAMWWTRGDRLLHAVAPVGDLGALFSWWRTHPSE